jgi:hypothetical protein
LTNWPNVATTRQTVARRESTPLRIALDALKAEVRDGLDIGDG